jgi:signal transduction histidine kinase
MFVALFTRKVGEDTDAPTRQWRAAIVFAIGLCAATAGLIWFAFAATRQWQRGTELLQERRATEALALAHAALVRDMKGAWVSLIVPIDHPALDEDPPYDLLHRTAQTFAKFPYVESVVMWKGDGPSPRTFVFSRSDRQPRWDHTLHSDDPYPVVTLQDAPALTPVLDKARGITTSTAPFALFETAIDGVPYQVVAHLLFRPAPPHQLARMVAFTVNLQWVRQQYFTPLLSQISSIGGADTSMALAVTDEQGALVATTGAGGSATSDRQRRFPFVFLEPTVLHAGPSSRQPIREFAVHVQTAAGAPSQAATSGALRILALITLTAIASVIALLQTVRAVRGSVRLASMKSEFVSAVTHELKTPLVTVRLVGDTLARGRYASTEAVQEYARMLSHEATRLSQSIDHLLTYARYADATSPIAFERSLVDVADMVDDALDRFRPTLAERGITVEVDVAHDLPRVCVDLRAITQVLEILLDNAIKYSADQDELSIAARPERPYVVVTVADHGIGIHSDDLPHVRERFFRGRNARASGSGLGLAIAQRIINHHGGKLRIRSAPGVGTEVDLLLDTRDT